ncbi:capping complex subunit for YIEGIA [Oceanobacillus caeni]|uniref:capping complex subunit for YIEGIA n=1 Tax=Oceanobacillus caeni TaxID=405946 RepID=UPI003641A0D6
MMIEKAILAIITLDPSKVSGGAPIFICKTKDELENVAANIEAITDGIVHGLSDELFIVVKH